MPGGREFRDHASETLRAQVAWASGVFQLPGLVVDLKINHKSTGPLGQAHVGRGQDSSRGRVEIQDYWFVNDRVIAYTEYGHLNGLADVGGFETDDWRLALDALIAHEVSHVVQWALRAQGSRHPASINYPDQRGLEFAGLGRWSGAHGPFFRAIYSKMRRRWVNDRVEAGTMTSPQFMFSEDSYPRQIADATGDHPLLGLKLRIRDHDYVVAGLNPRPARLYRYMLRREDGHYVKARLSLIASKSAEALRIIESDPELSAEMRHHVDLARRQLATNDRKRKR